MTFNTQTTTVTTPFQNLDEFSALREISDESAASCSGGKFFVNGPNPDVILYDSVYDRNGNPPTGAALPINATTGDGDDNLDNKFGGIGPYDFNNKTSSIKVIRGQWRIFEDDGYRGKSTVLKPGDYANPGKFGLSNDSLTGILRIG